ncbi:hypothetical protein OPIT5_04290 [Opitutaceae bacterium TAV5]|nr:hypothetical protein OPIT5_04290 [Opitutaceae bacterium TAV5]
MHTTYFFVPTDLIAAQSNKLEALQTHKKGLVQQFFPSPLEAVA